MAFKIKPKIDNGNNRFSFPKIAGEIRKSQSITTFGPGSLTDFPRLNAIIDGIDNWENTLGRYNFNKMKFYERNLEKVLGKKFFVQAQMLGEKKPENGILARRFPEYCYCPECGALDKFYKIEKKGYNKTIYNREAVCGICEQSKGRNVRLIPSRFIVACKCGHLTDFPYDWWVHRNAGKCGNPKLSISTSKETNSLDGIIIKCQCGAKESLDGIMDKGALYQLKCYGWMPWLGKNEDNKGWYSDLEYGEHCEEELRVLQRGANNVYYPSVVSALTIPPYSSRIQRVLSEDTVILSNYFDMPEQLKNANIKNYYESNYNKLRCSYDQFIRELNISLGTDETNFTSIRELMEGEYAALCDEDCHDQDFLTIEMPVPDELSQIVDQVKVVGRLREVQVLQGFKRIAPDEGVMAPLSRKPLNWFPGNELYGEGIFIRFNEEKVSAWEQHNIDRYSSLVARAQNNCIAYSKLGENSIRYILLHTISHLLIRELTLQCGYTSASIKEKIFSSDKNGKNMCGILVYTASSDSDGSLGGIARQGVTEKIRDTFLSMLETSTWCSNDPLCIDSKAQGYASLNYAACHACALLPETSCECCNVLLDRVALIGTSENPSLGFCNDIINNAIID